MAPSSLNPTSQFLSGCCFSCVGVARPCTLLHPAANRLGDPVRSPAAPLLRCSAPTVVRSQSTGAELAAVFVAAPWADGEASAVVQGGKRFTLKGLGCMAGRAAEAAEQGTHRPGSCLPCRHWRPTCGHGRQHPKWQLRCSRRTRGECLWRRTCRPPARPGRRSGRASLSPPFSTRPRCPSRRMYSAMSAQELPEAGAGCLEQELAFGQA